MADSNTDIFHILHTTRAMRRLKPDPVPDELIQKILEAGISAANGGNRQTWRFLVLKDRAVKERVQHFYKRAFDEVVGPRYRSSAPPPGVTPESYTRQHSAVEYLTEHFTKPPSGLWPASMKAPLRRHAPPGRRSTLPCRTCCWPPVPWAWAPRSRPVTCCTRPRSKRPWACLPASTPMPFSPSAILWDALVPSGAVHSLISSTKTAGGILTPGANSISTQGTIK